jgi:hypothetical protein
MKKAKFQILTAAWIVLLCLSVTFLAVAQEKDYEALLGEWDVRTEDGQYAFVFIFSMQDGTLKGMFQGSSGDVEMENLTYEGNELTFTVNIEAGGRSMPIDFSATIEGDSLEGMLSLEFGEANFSGKKRK